MFKSLPSGAGFKSMKRLQRKGWSFSVLDSRKVISESLALNAVENPVLNGLWGETEIWCAKLLEVIEC